MALVGNGVRLGASNPMRTLYGAQIYSANRGEWSQPGALRNLWAGQGVSAEAKYQAVPSGYRHPSAWSPAPKAGGLAARNELDGSGGVAGAIAGGLGAVAALTGAGDIVASLGALAGLTIELAGVGVISADIAGSVSAEAALAGSSSIVAALGLLVGAAASLAGSGALSADVSATISASASLGGTGGVTAALTAVSDIVASLLGAGGMTGTPSAKGHMSADLTVAGVVDPLSPASLAAAVWNALAADFVAAGTMGEVMGAGGSLTPTQATQLLELYRLAGLDPTKPLVVTASERTAGAEIEQTVVEAPAGTVTVTRQ